jgi:hypothetical protein
MGRAVGAAVFSLAEGIESQFNAKKGHNSDAMVVIFGKQECTAKQTK